MWCWYSSGTQWLKTRDGRERLNSPGDHVRTEIRQALESDVTVIPILVERALMPSPGDLPEDIRGLTQMNAVEIHDRSWQNDLRLLIEAQACRERGDAPGTRTGNPPFPRGSRDGG